MSTQDIFADLIWDWLAQRLNALSYGVDQERGEGDPVPFMLSTLFLSRFERVVRQLVIPEMISRSSGLLNRADQQDEDHRKEFLSKFFHDRKGRLVLWEAWQTSWHATMTEHRLPAKPQPQKRGLKSLLKRDKTKPAMTEKQWAAKTKRVQIANKVADKAWAHLIGDGKQYIKPDRSDGPMMIELFGRSVKVLKEQMNAIRQIVQQGGNIGKTFDMFSKNKKVNLALLAVCYQKPEEFLYGKQALKNILRGQSARDFPLIVKYLPDHIKGG